MDTLWLIKLWKNGDKAARDKIVEDNSKLIWSVVKRFEPKGCEKGDLYQIGVIGLLKAVDRFDFNYNVKFSTYAVPLIVGEIKRYLRDDGMIKVSRGIRDNCIRINKVKEELSEKLKREPSIDEIAKELELNKHDVILAMDALIDVDSLNRSCSNEHDASSSCLEDVIGEDNEVVDRIVNKMALKQVISELQKEEQNIIRMRFYEERTQSSIAKELGISQVQVSRLEKRILKKIRDKMILR